MRSGWLVCLSLMACAVTVLAAFVCDTALAPLAHAQAAPAAPEFDAASVKVVDRNSLSGRGGARATGGPGTADPGRFTDNVDTMMGLLMKSFGVESDQIVYPGRNSGDFYAVVATMPADTTKTQFQAMMQRLLIERFHLAVHHETRTFPAYELTIDRGGPKIKEAVSPPDDPPAPAGRRTIYFQPGVGSITMRWQTTGDLAGQIGMALQSAQRIQTQDMTSPLPRVVDKTGLAGRYTFTMEYAQPGPPGFTPEPDSPAAGLPDLFAALRLQLGLRLDKTAGVPVDVIVVDRVDKVPAAN